MSKISIKLVSTILSMTLITSVFCCCPVQAAAAEEVTAPQTNTSLVYPVTVRIDQQAGIAIAQKRAEEEAQAAAEQAAAQEAARQAAEAAQKEAEAKAAKQKSKTTTSSKKATPKYSKGGTTGQTIVNAAKSLIGTPYGANVGGINIDCSGLVCYAYQQVGISLPHSSSQQAKYCNDHGYAISKSELQPGDLVFWTYSWGSGFMNIGHVGIYAGNGQVIDASPSGVVQRSLYDQSSICFYGRPY